MEYLAALSAFACNTQLDDLPRALVERGRWIFADSLAVIAAGMQTPELKAFRERYLADVPSRGAWVIGAGRRARRYDAAMLNGAAGTWFELDEGNVHASGHPGIQLVPAAIAYANTVIPDRARARSYQESSASPWIPDSRCPRAKRGSAGAVRNDGSSGLTPQEEGVSGKDLLLAILLGYEVSSRIAHAAQMRRHVHPHGTWGVIGAAVAVGRLAHLTPEHMRTAINIAAATPMATSYGTLRDGATVRNIYTGHSNAAGQAAVDMTLSGFTGETDAVASIYGALLGEGFDPAAALEGLGSEWLTLQSYFKIHPTGRSVHSAIDALEDALSGARLKAADVERIEVTAYRKTAVMAQKNVQSGFGAKFSVPFALATIIHHGRSGLASFSDEATAVPEVRALCQRVDLKEDPAYTAEYPRRQLCDVKIMLRDGRTLSGRSERMKGEPENPHKPDELERKYFELATPVWGEALSRRLLDECMRLDSIADFREYSARFDL